MSDIISPADVVDPEAHSEAANAVDDTNRHTPVPEPVPVVHHVPDSVTPDPTVAVEHLEEIVAGLADTVAGLSAAVLALTHDETPTKVPWTHRGGMTRD